MTSEAGHQDAALKNQILASLPKAEYDYLRPHLTWEEMSLGQVLYDPGQPVSEVYFPIRSLTSLISKLPDDHQIEISLVGNEGLVGLSALLGGGSGFDQAIVQVADGAMKIDAQILRERFLQGGVLQKQILLYIQLTLTQMAQNVNCQVHHKIEPRFARWLLSIQDRLQATDLPLTQRYAATLLGTRRATITEAAGKLQGLGLIRYRRGRITICDRPGLEQAACKCYTLLREEQNRLQQISRQLQ